MSNLLTQGAVQAGGVLGGAAANSVIATHAAGCASCLGGGVGATALAGTTQATLTALMLAHPVGWVVGGTLAVGAGICGIFVGSKKTKK